MGRRARHTWVVLAALLLATTLAFDGTTVAAKTLIHTKVSIHVRRQGTSAITLWGRYNNVSPHCRLARRRVDILVNGHFRSRIRTRAGGLYHEKIVFRHLHHGRHSVQSRVYGRVWGGYGTTFVCLDALSRKVFLTL